MTARRGGAYGRGYSSSGESIVELPSEARERARQERVRTMAKENAAKAQDAFHATPGATAKGVKAVEEPLRVGTRDALIEDGHNDGDYVPDVESKGYHVGMVRQPAQVAVNAAGQPVGFISERPSKFEGAPTLADAKAYHNEVESSDDWNEDVSEATLVTASEQEVRAAGLYDAKSGTKAKAATAKAADSGSDE